MRRVRLAERGGGGEGEGINECPLEFTINRKEVTLSFFKEVAPFRKM
jgi:hypothetical protein